MSGILVLVAAMVFVSPSGSDANPGTRERPLATPAAARDAVRKLSGGEKVVEFADGFYRLTKPLILEAQDSGTTWRAANRGKAVLGGSVKPTAYGRVSDPDVLALLPEGARDKVVYAEFPADVTLPGFCGGGCGTPPKLVEYPISVFQGDRRLIPARWPNEGFARTGENIGKAVAQPQQEAGSATTGVFAFKSERLARWAKEPDLWAYGLWRFEWADTKTRVTKVDVAAGTIAVDVAPIVFGIREDAQFYILNALSELDRPGEWVLDRRRRRIYVWPVEGAGPLSFACADGLVRAARLTDVVIDGLVFDCSRTDAVTFRDCSRCTVRASTVRRTSAGAICMEGGVSNRVVGCDLYDLGEGGVTLRGGDFRSLTPGGHVADNNHIHHYGRVVANYRPGVQLYGVGCRATHNLIHHSDHQAIAFEGNDHYVGWNVVHDTCLYNDDAGAIYCCQRDWTKRGTVIERNVIHLTGKQPRPMHTEAIYLDDFSSGVIVRNNIVNRSDLGVYVGGGNDCTVYGNVFLNCSHGIEHGSRGIETFAKNISELGRKSSMFRRLDELRPLLESDLWRTRYPNLLKVYDFEDAVFAHNAIFNVYTNNVMAGCGPNEWQNWEKVGPLTVRKVNVELTDDPGFVDYAHFDWELRPDAPAAKVVGRTEFAKMGLYESPDRASPAVKFGSDIKSPPPIMRRYDPATVRIDLPFDGPLPAGVERMADGLVRCELPDWGSYRRICAFFGPAATEDWRDYSFSFTPCCDGTVFLETMGARGEKTLYDDIRVTGSEIADGGFETGQDWALPHPDPKDYRAPNCNLRPPYGIIDAATAGCAPAEGKQMACGNDMLTFRVPLKVKKGVAVTVSFKARALDR